MLDFAVTREGLHEGVSDSQASSRRVSTEQVTALAELIDTQAASKSDLLELEHRLEAKIADGNIATIKWVVGLVLAVIKLFQH